MFIRLFQAFPYKYYCRKAIMADKGKAPAKDKGKTPISHQMLVPFYNPGISPQSQNLIDQLWSAILSAKRKQTRNPYLSSPIASNSLKNKSNTSINWIKEDFQFQILLLKNSLENHSWKRLLQPFQMIYLQVSLKRQYLARFKRR